MTWHAQGGVTVERMTAARFLVISPQANQRVTKSPEGRTFCQACLWTWQSGMDDPTQGQAQSRQCNAGVTVVYDGEGREYTKDGAACQLVDVLQVVMEVSDDIS